MSLLCRLKNLVHKGVLKKEDLDRIVIIPKGQESCDCISRQQAIDKMQELEDEDIKAYGCEIPEGFDGKRAIEALKALSPSIQQKIGQCKDCKQWRDSDGLYRRGINAESNCPINSSEVFEGNGYCYMFEPKKK